MAAHETILVFDSGLGGLTVYREIAAARPNADFVYAADDAASRLESIAGSLASPGIRALARLGPDRISVGRITHSAPALDMSLELDA